MAHHHGSARVSAAFVYHLQLKQKIEAEEKARIALELKRKSALKSVEIYTDASYINQYKVGAVSYIIASENDELYKDALLVHEKSDTTHLEIMAISVAVRKCRELYPNAQMTVYTDNVMAMHFYNKRFFDKKSKFNQKFLDRIAYHEIFMLPVSYKHIKGHQPDSTSIQNMFNNKVDQMGRSLARKLVKKIRIRNNK